MPEVIELGRTPGGYTLNAAREDETVSIQYREFISSEDGQLFIQRLEGIPTDILNRLPQKINPAQVDSLLAIIDGEGIAHVYINEIEQRVRVRASGPLEAGTVVTKNDIVDVDRLDFNVDIPVDVGIVFVFSVGWRKGLYYDFGPISGPEASPREYDISASLGQAYCHVLFQERFSISDEEWQAFFAAKWFPFVALEHDGIDTLIRHVRSGWDPDEQIDEFVNAIKDRLPKMMDSWKSHPSFLPHVEILDRAAERFQADDYVSCTALLFPRIEGILRTHHSSLGATTNPSPDNLTSTAVSSKISNEKCLLLPHRFVAYLRDIYFADFSPDSGPIGVSRHSVAHGVATASDFNKKSALIAILVVHQLFYFLENRSNTTESSEGDSDS